jgi:hypothetical protein
MARGYCGIANLLDIRSTQPIGTMSYSPGFSAAEKV